MRNLHSILSGRVSAIRKRVVKSKSRARRPATNGSGHPGLADLSAKLARASERLRGGRHGRRTG